MFKRKRNKLKNYVYNLFSCHYETFCTVCVREGHRFFQFHHVGIQFIGPVTVINHFSLFLDYYEAILCFTVFFLYGIVVLNLILVFLCTFFQNPFSFFFVKISDNPPHKLLRPALNINKFYTPTPPFQCWMATEQELSQSELTTTLKWGVGGNITKLIKK